jgi:transcriptional regulator with XRE-family HTH domain
VGKNRYVFNIKGNQYRLISLIIFETRRIEELVELKLFEHKMTQSRLAEEIGLAKSKVSEILNGKRKADIAFLKGIHKVLKIDAGLLLEIV